MVKLFEERYTNLVLWFIFGREYVKKIFISIIILKKITSVRVVNKHYGRREVQCVTIENRQSPFYVVNRVTLTGKTTLNILLVA